MQLNIMRMDSKGRISIPAHVRESVGIKGGDTITLVTNGRKELTVLPLLAQDTVVVKATMKSPQGVKELVNIFNSHKMDILSLESIALERDEKYECTATLGKNGCDLEALRKEIEGASIDAEVSAYSF